MSIEKNNFNELNSLPPKEDSISLTGEEIADRINNQEDLNNDFAIYLLNNNKIDDFIKNIQCFNNLNQEVALKLIEAGEGYLVTNHFKKFTGLNQEVADKLIEAGAGYSVAENLEKFAGLNQEVAIKLIVAKNDYCVFNNLERFEGLNLNQEVALKLIEAGAGYSVANNLERFTGLNHQEIAFKLIETGKWRYVAYSLEKFTGLNHQEVALKLIEAGEGYLVTNKFEEFTGLNLNQEVADKLIEVGHGNLVAYHLKKFAGLNQEVALKLIEAGYVTYVLDYLERFEGLNLYQKIFDKLIETGDCRYVAYRLEKFTGLNHQEVALKLIEAGEGDSVAENLEKFAGLNQEVAIKLIVAGNDYCVFNNLERFEGLNLNQEVALKLIEAGAGYSVADNLERFTGLNREVALKLIETGEWCYVADNSEKFTGLNHQEVALKLIEAGKGYLVTNNFEKFKDLSRDTGNKLIKSLTDFSLIIKANDYFNPPLDKMVAKTSEIFGSFASTKNFSLIKAIDNNDQEVIEKLKLKKGGNDGLRELQERFTDFKKSIISEDFDTTILLENDHNSDLYLPYFKSYIRYNESQWGDNNDVCFRDIIDSYNYFESDDCLRDNYKKNKKLNPNFQPSQEILITKSNEKARESHQFNGHFLNRFAVLINSLKKSKELYQEKFPLTKLVEQIEEKRQALIQELKEKADKLPNPQAKEGIARKIGLLESINIRSLKDFQSNFSILAQNKEFNELLRQAVFLFSFSKNRQSLNYDLDQVDLKKPKLDDISWTLNFIDHISNQETMSKYFTDKKSAKLFNEVVSTKAIIDEMSLLQNKGNQSKETTKIQFIPDRGILTEFSGHIADACWASKYNSILNSFPNFTSVIIRQNPETKFERLAGAFMLIETESKEGEPLLVIRGLNPIENLINSLSVKNFYEKTMEYLKELAKKDNRRLAIVIDDHSGGSATNRPVLFEYLNKLSQELKAIDLKSRKDTDFNGYNITRQTYLVD